MYRRVIPFVCLLAISGVLCAQAPPPGWHKHYTDSLQGVRSDEALHLLAKHPRHKAKEIIVGIIDSGVDTTSVNLRPAFWNNPKEKMNGRDDDKNGYVDDLHGWNFLGTTDGTFNMTSAGTEEYREFKRLYPKYKNADSSSVENPKEFAYYEEMKKKAGIVNYIKYTNYTAMKHQAYHYLDSALGQMPDISKDTLTIRGMMLLPMPDDTWEAACNTLLADFYQADKSQRWEQLVKKNDDQLELMKTRLRGIEKDPDKHLLIDNEPDNPLHRFYGNATLQTEGCEHGTGVAGAIAGQGIGHPEAAGVYPKARLMILRAAADGDEYDKDVASAIRYAVDNGAKVINMSLGKYTSPQAGMVNEAIAYAASKDVLIIQAAGNNHLNVDSVAYFPSAIDKKGKRFDNFLRVGASDAQGRLSSFSNYGATHVDVLAPGETITTVMPGNEYAPVDGTSISAPIVSGVAAMLRAYFPKLKAADIKRILIQTARHPQQEGLSVTGVIDAEAAVRSAMNYKQ